MVVSPEMIGNNPLLNTLWGSEVGEEEQDYRDQLRESELRLLGTMLFQSVLLAFCILLYVNWTWSHFNTAYESAIFYGFAGFSVQAAFYFIYRAAFEDSNQHYLVSHPRSEVAAEMSHDEDSTPDQGKGLPLNPSSDSKYS